MRTSLILIALVCMFSLMTTFVSQTKSQNSLIEFVPAQLIFESEEGFPIASGRTILERTLVLKDISGRGFSNITLISTSWYELNSSEKISPENVHFDQSNFSIPAGGFHETIVTLEVPSVKHGTYRGYILVLTDNNETLHVDATLLAHRSAFVTAVIFSIVLLLVLFVFWLLLQENGYMKIRLIASIAIITIELLLVMTATPFGPELSSILVTAIFSPLIAYLISILKAERDFSKQIDLASHDYRKRMIERESDIIGSLIGELTTHVAAFAANDWPRPRELPEKVWEKSEKVGLISDIHTQWLAKYYHYVPLYNRCVGIIGESSRKNTEKETSRKVDAGEKSFTEVKKAFAAVETLLYHMLTYDLGSLQQKYLARQTVLFPYHMSLLLRETLGRFGIIRNGEEIDKHVYSDTSSKRFNLKMGMSFNACYAQLEGRLSSLLNSLEKSSAT